MTRFIHRLFESRLLFTLTISILVYGLFLVPASKDPNRIANSIWNLGHVVAFIVVWLFVFRLSPVFKQLSANKLLLVVSASSLLIGAVIEGVQYFVGRDVALLDVLNSGVGGFLAVTFFTSQVDKLTAWQRLTLRVVALVVLVAIPWSMWSALADEMILRRQFPVLSGFTTPFELSRWQAKTAELHLQKTSDSEHALLGIDFRPAMYSTVSLRHFYHDWRGYKQLVMDVTNPESADLIIILRIHDRLHKRHAFALKDRYNLPLLIKSGRQRISIALSNVENAPRSRKMDMQHIEDVSIFTMQSKVYHKLYIHRIFLE